MERDRKFVPDLPPPVNPRFGSMPTLDPSALAEREGTGEGMSQGIVRCPYCVLDAEFRPMFSRSKRSYVCVSCGHTATAGGPSAKCGCTGCRKLNQIVSRLSREYSPLDPARSA